MPPTHLILVALSGFLVGALCQGTCPASVEKSYDASITYLGCYRDPTVSILSAAKLSTIAMTPQVCANWCGERGFAYGGIERGT
jgi:beta-D-xylosidase 4